MNSIKESINKYLKSSCTTPVERDIINLKKTQKEFLKRIDSIIDIKTDILDIPKNNLYKQYNGLRALMKVLKIDSYDLNDFLNNYNSNSLQSNEKVRYIKKLVKCKNMRELIGLKNTEIWKQCIMILKGYCDKVFASKCSKESIEDSLIRLMKKYCGHIDGFWTTVSKNKNKIISIHIVDPMDMHYFIKMMHKHHKKIPRKYHIVNTIQHNRI